MHLPSLQTSDQTAQSLSVGQVLRHHALSPLVAVVAAVVAVAVVAVAAAAAAAAVAVLRVGCQGSGGD